MAALCVDSGANWHNTFWVSTQWQATLLSRYFVTSCTFESVFSDRLHFESTTQWHAALWVNYSVTGCTLGQYSGTACTWSQPLSDRLHFVSRSVTGRNMGQSFRDRQHRSVTGEAVLWVSHSMVYCSEPVTSHSPTLHSRQSTRQIPLRNSCSDRLHWSSCSMTYGTSLCQSLIGNTISNQSLSDRQQCELVTAVSQSLSDCTLSHRNTLDVFRWPIKCDSAIVNSSMSEHHSTMSVRNRRLHHSGTNASRRNIVVNVIQ